MENRLRGIFNGLTAEQAKAFKRVLKGVGKREVERNSHGDPYAESISEKPRKAYRDYDSWIEYGLYELDEEQAKMTDEELDKDIWDAFKIHFRREAWDCTGKPFTMAINWHRNPCGLVSIKHHIALDV